MKKKILMLCMGCFLVSLTAKAQWVVSDPGNLAQGIINAAKNIVHTSSTATNMANSFQETVKIYRQGKEYYDGLRKVKNLVRDARKVQQTILMVGDITDMTAATTTCCKTAAWCSIIPTRISGCPTCVPRNGTTWTV